jgi:rhodanese-related sulfurtransferase
MRTISRDDLHSVLAEVTVVDALPEAPYRVRHLPGALNLVVDGLDAEGAQLLPDRSAEIVTYSTDSACGRGEALGERLEQLGYTNIRVYRDGIEDWVGAGLPVEAGERE